MKPRNPDSIFILPPEATKKIFLFTASLALALVLMLVTAGENFTYAQHCVLFLLYFSILLWVTEAAAPFAVGIFIVGYLVFALGKEDGLDVGIYVRTWIWNWGWTPMN